MISFVWFWFLVCLFCSCLILVPPGYIAVIGNQVYDPISIGWYFAGPFSIFRARYYQKRQQLPFGFDGFWDGKQVWDIIGTVQLVIKDPIRFGQIDQGNTKVDLSSAFFDYESVNPKNGEDPKSYLNSKTIENFLQNRVSRLGIKIKRVNISQVLPEEDRWQSKMSGFKAEDWSNKSYRYTVSQYFGPSHDYDKEWLPRNPWIRPMSFREIVSRKFTSCAREFKERMQWRLAVPHF